MPDFRNIMSKHTNSELVDITTLSRHEYQPEAVLAAEQELKSRNLTDQQLADANYELELKLEENKKRNERLKSIENKANEAINVFNPLAEKSLDKQIKIVSVVLAIAYLAYVVSDWDLTILMVKDIGNFDISSLEYFAPLILFPIGLFGFWTGKKYGWVILTVLFTYYAVTALVGFSYEIKWMYEPVLFDSNGPQESENNVPFYLALILVYIGLLIFINKKSITEKYQVSRQTQFLAIGITASSLILFVITMLI